MSFDGVADKNGTGMKLVLITPNDGKVLFSITLYYLKINSITEYEEYIYRKSTNSNGKKI